MCCAVRHMCNTQWLCLSSIGTNGQMALLFTVQLPGCWVSSGRAGVTALRVEAHAMVGCKSQRYLHALWRTPLPQMKGPPGFK
jgi:hypothetical protein